MVTHKSTERGFTLVEVIVVGVLLAILALGAFTLFMMYVNTTRETEVNLRMQRQADALLDEISRRVRNASFVFKDNSPNEHPSKFNVCTSADGSIIECDDESWEPIVVVDGEEDGSLGSEIFISNIHGDHLSRFGFSNDAGGIVLMDGEPFMIGGDTVKIEFDKSTFEVRNDRRQVRINVMIRANVRNSDYTLNIQRGVFRCRN